MRLFNLYLIVGLILFIQIDFINYFNNGLIGIGVCAFCLVMVLANQFEIRRLLAK